MPIKISQHSISTEERIMKELESLGKDDGLSVSELKDKTGLTTSTIKEAVKRSEKIARCKVPVYGMTVKYAFINPKYAK